MDGQGSYVPLSVQEPGSGQEDRGGLLAYVTDAETEMVLRDGLTDAGCSRLDIRRGGLRTVISDLRNMPTPRVLIVDVEGETDAVRALLALSEVAEPSAAVLVIGDSNDVDLYRELTRGLGVTEYLPKPLSRDRVARLFGPIVLGQAFSIVTSSGGRSIAITGTSGGVGATTVAVNLAWHLAAKHRRHTCLLDGDLYLGTAALFLDMGMRPGLLSALQAPDRIDTIFLERTAETVSEDAVGGRLSLLASEVPLANPIDYAPGAAGKLMAAMRLRYNVVIIDAPFSPEPFARDILSVVTQRVLVLEPTLSSIRGALRLGEIPAGEGQSLRPIVVLNRLGRPGGLSRSEVEHTIGKAVDIVIPELPRKVTEAANVGRPLIESNTQIEASIEQLARQLSIPRLVSTMSRPAGVSRKSRASDRFGLGRLARR